MSSPKQLLQHWNEVVPSLARAEGVALFLDYDGTLTRIRRRPADAWLSAGMRDVLTRVARTPVLMGIVTGRGLADARARVGLGGIWYASDHGYCVLDPLQRLTQLANASERARIERTRKFLGKAIAKQRSLIFDAKAASLAVHYRAATRSAARAGELAVREAVAAEPGLQVLAGKKVWEVLPGDRVDKWSAIELILRRAGSKRSTVIFLGDDVTDERVFQKMEGRKMKGQTMRGRKMIGLSVFVGTGRETAARYWLGSPTEVREFLRRCARLWDARSGGENHKA